jgi:hypothetical protein
MIRICKGFLSPGVPLLIASFLCLDSAYAQETAIYGNVKGTFQVVREVFYAEAYRVRTALKEYPEAWIPARVDKAGWVVDPSRKNSMVEIGRGFFDQTIYLGFEQGRLTTILSKSPTVPEATLLLWMPGTQIGSRYPLDGRAETRPLFVMDHGSLVLKGAVSSEVSFRWPDIGRLFPQFWLLAPVSETGEIRGVGTHPHVGRNLATQKVWVGFEFGVPTVVLSDSPMEPTRAGILKLEAGSVLGKGFPIDPNAETIPIFVPGEDGPVLNRTILERRPLPDLKTYWIKTKVGFKGGVHHYPDNSVVCVDPQYTGKPVWVQYENGRVVDVSTEPQLNPIPFFVTKAHVTFVRLAYPQNENGTMDPPIEIDWMAREAAHRLSQEHAKFWLKDVLVTTEGELLLAADVGEITVGETFAKSRVWVGFENGKLTTILTGDPSDRQNSKLLRWNPESELGRGFEVDERSTELRIYRSQASKVELIGIVPTWSHELQENLRGVFVDNLPVTDRGLLAFTTKEGDKFRVSKEFAKRRISIFWNGPEDFKVFSRPLAAGDLALNLATSGRTLDQIFEEVTRRGSGPSEKQVTELSPRNESRPGEELREGRLEKCRDEIPKIVRDVVKK